MTETPIPLATASAATQILRALVGRDDAVFHDGQLEAISAIVDERRRVLVVQRTGWGKSAVYFIASLMLRARGSGPTILISPLLALMRDQVEAAGRAGVRAVSMSSANAHEWAGIREQLAADEIDVLLVSPERLNNPEFRDTQLPELLERTGLVVVDEAHCISDWGHDFRPDYRRIASLISGLGDNVPVLATTATANERVVHDIEEQLGRSEILTIRGPLARASLRLGVLRLGNARERLAWLLQHLDELPGSGIIYTLTVAGAEDTSAALREAGIHAPSYTGKTDPDERERLEGALKRNEVKALVATSALGMGFDKPDLGFVVHLGAPSSPVAYYQQVGRAGRSSASADVLLLPGDEDRAIWEYFATVSMPDEARAQAVLGALGDAPRSTVALEAAVDLRRSRLELLLKVLDVDGAVRREQGGWVSTGQPWSYDGERYARIAAARSAEAQAMIDYERTEGCRMEFLQRQLDDATAAPCGRCDNCAGVWFDATTDAAVQARAGAALDRVGADIAPRRQWPSGMASLGVELKGRISKEEQASEGRVLARLSDLGWGGPLRELFGSAGPDTVVTGPLLQACIRILSEWKWDARPQAVAYVPSRSRPQLGASLAEGIAAAGRLPLLGPLDLVRGGPAGQPGGNSAFRLSHVAGRFSTASIEVPSGPVLLIDDFVDSGWTMTVCARELRRAGASAVLPLALAQRG
ncbi:RecQ family ATP-dependent DNA helicase [Pseudoclavibacter helvolus]|uniref:RecQ family ATP-dependent DNA helicase n=1 Tax=Pseudoclavibacter helvolus TaxID=255205 RepID=UPI003C78FE0E